MDKKESEGRESESDLLCKDYIDASKRGLEVL